LPSDDDVSATKVCPTCSAEYPETERFCPKDGMALHSARVVTDLVGSVIAERYHVLKRLGAGGMGRVYLAEHVKMGRRCALKVLHPAMAGDPDAIVRFNREAANASRIDHANVAAIYDFGETQEGLLYLAMQYVEGETLTRLMTQSGALPPLRTLDLVRQIADGLHAAHVLGIVHRDLKPDNIMVSTDADGIDHVKVVDFGIAKAAEDRGPGVTRTGVVIGTPEYMSPEQLAGDPVDERSDHYSLALVTFALLTGKLPFPAASTGKMVVTRLTEPPQSLGEVRPEVTWPNELETVMSRALDRDPSRRHASTRDFAAALHAAIATMPMTTTIPAQTAASPRTRVIESAPGDATTMAASRSSDPSANTESRRPHRRVWVSRTVIAASTLLLIGMGVAASGAVRRARARAALQQGISAYRQGRTADAKARLRAASVALPSDPRPHVYLSRLAREANDLTTASEEGIQAVRLAPDDGAALRELATTLFAMENFSGARAFYVRAIAADPADHTSQGYLGCTLLRLGRGDEGMRWLERAGSGTWSSCAPARNALSLAR
jgi:serine/threonine protein kinase/Flp pilus assembly protein TadD